MGKTFNALDEFWQLEIAPYIGEYGGDFDEDEVLRGLRDCDAIAWDGQRWDWNHALCDEDLDLLFGAVLGDCDHGQED